MIKRAIGSPRTPSATLALGILLATALGLARPVGAQSDNAGTLAEAEALGWVVGAADAPVTVVEFTDVSCPYCASFHAGTRAGLVEEFVSSGQVRWVTVTYVSGLYPNSLALSGAAECAGRQGSYEEFLGAAYEDRDGWVRGDHEEVSAAIDRLVGRTGLDADVLESCLRDPALHERLGRVTELARGAGVRGTPTWFVDGFLVMGDLPLTYARQFIETRLPG